MTLFLKGGGKVVEMVAVMGLEEKDYSYVRHQSNSNAGRTPLAFAIFRGKQSYNIYKHRKRNCIFQKTDTFGGAGHFRSAG